MNTEKPEKLTGAQYHALAAVEDGRVRQRHPFTWVLGPEDLTVVTPRALQALAQRVLIKVIIAGAAPGEDYDRRVIVTERGTAALAAHRAKAGAA